MRIVSYAGFTISVVFGAATLYAQTSPTEIFQGHKAAASEILVKVKLPSSAIASALSQAFDADSVQGVGSNHWFRIHSRSKNVATLMTQAMARTDIIGFEPNYLATVGSLPSIMPNDPDYGKLWGLKKIGADIAWNYTTGGARDAFGQARGVVVGVVDTGAYTSHEDLAANIWSVPADFSVCFGSSYATDPMCTNGTIFTCPAGSPGFNALATPAAACAFVDDDAGHGTHVAGTIGAVGDNNKGVVGVNWTAPIMVLKSCDQFGFCLDSSVVNAISFAEQAKAHFANTSTPVNVRVLNNSYGHVTIQSQALLDEINSAGANGMLFVAIADNQLQGQNIDPSQPGYPNFPATYNLDPTVANEIVVYATADNTDAIASYSNYGPLTVDLGAPGGRGSAQDDPYNIYSTWPPSIGPLYKYDWGTSMAAPHVAGTAQLMLTRCSLTTTALKAVIRNNVDIVASGSLYSSTGGASTPTKPFAPARHGGPFQPKRTRTATAMAMYSLTNRVPAMSTPTSAWVTARTRL